MNGVICLRLGLTLIIHFGKEGNDRGPDEGEEDGQRERMCEERERLKGKR